nr:MAG: ORF1 [Torque teno midi virus]
MPFWWNRRRRPWYGRWFKRRKYNKRRRRYKRKPRRRYRYRRFAKGRRRRRKTVRKKKKTLILKQYQPDCIRKCKIKGIGLHIAGAHGRQFQCFTDIAKDPTPELQPGGGGFGVEKFTLQHLYNENKAGNNIWTASNKFLDLARYLGGRIKFWRHPTADFIVEYSRTLPMKLDQFTYPETYPQNMLLAKHKKIIPSLKTQPRGKRYVQIKFKPPKILTNKWYFQESLANTGLLQLRSSLIDLRYPHIGCCNTNELVTLTGINLDVYSNGGWGNATHPTTATSDWYLPNNRIAKTFHVTVKGQKKQVTLPTNNYLESVSYEKGWFQPLLLQATQIQEQSWLFGTACRYNPKIDTGRGNKVWFASTLKYSYQPPSTDKDLILEGLPLYELLYGFNNYIQKLKGDKTFLNSYCLFIQSPALLPQHSVNQFFCPIDYSFIQGKGPYDSYVTQDMKQKWFPKVLYQQKSINNIVTSGPFIPKLDNQNLSTWELYSNYYFYFKFGGATLPDPDTVNPETQGTYPVPSNQQQRVQIVNPEKTSPYATLHSWDYRRGIITGTAYKRMCENQETDTDFQTDAAPPKKKKKTSLPGNALQVQEEELQEIQDCLRSLCEKSISQESEEKETDILKLIKQQQQQQQHIKQDLLKLIVDLKNKQKMLQLHTGVLE